MPSYGISEGGGTVLRWLKAEGEPVGKGEALVEVETEKAVTEIEAPCTGVLAQIVAREGRKVEVGEMLARINEVGLESSHPTNNPKERVYEGAVSDGVEAIKEQASESAHSSRQVDPDIRPSLPEPPLKASPGARRLASGYGIDLTRVKGTGPQGRIVEEDVKAFAQSHAHDSSPAEESISQESRMEELTPTRRVIAERMTESVRSIPHIHLSRDVDGTALSAAREQSQGRGSKVSVTALLVKALAETLAGWPRLNSSWGRDGIEIHPGVHISVAVATPRGLMAPVVRDVSLKSVSEIDRQLGELIARAKGGHVRPQDLSGGTFTLTNLGMYGVRQFDPLINPPQCAVLAVGAIRECPFASNGSLGIRPELTLTLAVDHRIVDGAEAAEFLRELCRKLEILRIP